MFRGKPKGAPVGVRRAGVPERLTALLFAETKDIIIKIAEKR